MSKRPSAAKISVVIEARLQRLRTNAGSWLMIDRFSTGAAAKSAERDLIEHGCETMMEHQGSPWRESPAILFARISTSHGKKR